MVVHLNCKFSVGFAAPQFIGVSLIEKAESIVM